MLKEEDSLAAKSAAVESLWPAEGSREQWLPQGGGVETLLWPRSFQQKQN